MAYNWIQIAFLVFIVMCIWMSALLIRNIRLLSDILSKLTQDKTSAVQAPPPVREEALMTGVNAEASPSVRYVQSMLTPGDENDDGEILAVIAAAIAAYEEEQNP